MYIVCYDISDPKRLRRVARIMEGYGERVQLSVFECPLDAPRYRAMKARIRRVIDPEQDRVRYYRLCGYDRKDVLFDGLGGPLHDPVFEVP